MLLSIGEVKMEAVAGLFVGWSLRMCGGGWRSFAGDMFGSMRRENQRRWGGLSGSLKNGVSSFSESHSTR
jgi:hypothetical protein